MLLNEGDPFKQQLIAALQDPEIINFLHQYSDYLDTPTGLHHQLGPRHDQSAYGDHTHDGVSSSHLNTDGIFTPQFSTAGTWVTTGEQGNYLISNGMMFAWFKAVYSSGGFLAGQPLDLYFASGFNPVGIAKGSAQAAHALDGTIIGMGTLQGAAGPFGIMTSAAADIGDMYAVGPNGNVWNPGFAAGAVISGFYSYPIL